jgi:hypothetical protein
VTDKPASHVTSPTAFNVPDTSSVAFGVSVEIPVFNEYAALCICPVLVCVVFIEFIVTFVSTKVKSATARF